MFIWEVLKNIQRGLVPVLGRDLLSVTGHKISCGMEYKEGG